VIISPRTAFDVGIEPAASATDADRVAEVAALVNGVYEQAEAGLWVDRARRTSRQEIAELITRGQIVTARTSDRVVGAVRVRALDGDTAEFGMLAADPAQRGLGIGRALVAFAERWAVDRGLSFMQLELLVPTTWNHPSKQFLRDWYSRLGYRVVRTSTLEESYPDLAPLLATPCDLLVYRKALDD
jgi:ribosomal protein S18 acetylase RimI-like enzyme